MALSAAHDRERRFALGYERKGRLRGQENRGIRVVGHFRAELGYRGYFSCALRSYPGHTCRGKLVVDHDHYCSVGHAVGSACPRCVRGLLCSWGNNQIMAVYDEEFRVRGETHLPPEIAHYMKERPLL